MAKAKKTKPFWDLFLNPITMKREFEYNAEEEKKRKINKKLRKLNREMGIENETDLIDWDE